MFLNYYVLKLLLLETITFSDATLSDKNVVLRYTFCRFTYKSMCVRNERNFEV